MQSIHVQCNWNELVSSVLSKQSTREKFWVSVKTERNAPLLEFYIQVSLNSSSSSLTLTTLANREDENKPLPVSVLASCVIHKDNSSSTSHANKELMLTLTCTTRKSQSTDEEANDDVAHNSETIVRHFVSSISEFDHFSNRGAILCMDLSGGGTMGIIGSTEGRLRVWDANEGTLRRDLRGHVSDVTCCMLLPSNKVAISGADDMQIKIWNLEHESSDSSCVVTLKGHTSGVTSLDYIDRGRNFVSSSRDGTVRLWDCATQSTITKLYEKSNEYGVHGGINQVSLATNNSLGSDVPAVNNKDFSTQFYLAAIASDDGSLSVVDVRCRKTLFSFTHSSALHCCQFLQQGNVVVAGSNDGSVLKCDLRMNSTPAPFQLSSLSIRAMCKHEANSVWITTADGSCFLWNATDNTIPFDLTGADFDPLNAVRSYHRTIFTAGRDGVVRKYNVPQI